MQTQSSASPGESSNWLFREIAAQLKPGGDAGLRKRIENDFMYLHDICGHNKICYEGTQKKMVDFILDTPVVPVEDRGQIKRHLEAPRGAFKSSNLQTWALQMCLKYRSWIRVLYASETFTNSKVYVGWIKRQIKGNPRILEAYGDLEGDRWSEDQFVLKGRPMPLNEATLTAAGIGVTKTGMHYDLIICDDLVSKDNSQTKDGLEAIILWYKYVLSILAQDGVIVVCGTRYNDGDLYGHLLKPERVEEYKTLRLSALRRREGIAELLEGKAHPIFSHISTKYLRGQYVEQGPYVFSCQYLNNPVDDTVALFKRRQFRIMQENEIPKGCLTYMLADTANTEKQQNDYWAIWIVDLDSIGNCYVRDLRMGHWNPTQGVDWLMRLAQRWHPRKLTIEVTGANYVYRPQIEREKREQQIKFALNLVPRPGNESKYMRISSLHSRFEMGTIFFSDFIDHDLIRVEGSIVTGLAVEQFVRYPKTSHDDAPDALADLDRLDKFGGRMHPLPSKRQMDNLAKPTLINNSLTAEAVRAAATDTGSGDKWKQARRNQRSWARRGGR